MSAPRPLETDPFHPLGSTCNIKQLLYICTNLPVISSLWDAQVCIMTIAHVILQKPSRAIFKVMIFFTRVHAGAH